MEQLSAFFSSGNGTAVIATVLGAFFLVAALIKGARSRHHRQMRESAEYAVANGGTPDSPVHIGNPFKAERQAAPETPVDMAVTAPSAAGEAPSAPAPAAGAAAPVAAAATPPPQQPPAKAPDPDDAYIWQ